MIKYPHLRLMELTLAILCGAFLTSSFSRADSKAILPTPKEPIEKSLGSPAPSKPEARREQIVKAAANYAFEYALEYADLRSLPPMIPPFLDIALKFDAKLAGKPGEERNLTQPLKQLLDERALKFEALGGLQVTEFFGREIARLDEKIQHLAPSKAEDQLALISDRIQSLRERIIKLQQASFGKKDVDLEGEALRLEKEISFFSSIAWFNWALAASMLGIGMVLQSRRRRAATKATPKRPLT